MNVADDASRFILPERQVRLVAIVIACAMFMTGLESTILATAMPRMAADFDVPPTSLSSAITLYVLVNSAMVPASNWIAHRFGPLRVFSAAILGFIAASLVCGLTHTYPEFLAARAVQALFGSLMLPVGNLILLKVTPMRMRVATVAISTTPALLAPVLGPPLGGLIVSFLHWGWLFFINIPLGILTLIAARRLIPAMPRVPNEPFDRKGFLLSSGAMILLIGGLDRLSSAEGGTRLAMALLPAGLAVGWLAVRHARRAAHPLVPLGSLRLPCFRTATLEAGSLVRVAFAAHGLMLPLMLQLGLGLSPVVSGVMLLAQNAGDLMLKAVATRALRRMGFRRAMTSSAATMAAAIAVVAILGPGWPPMAIAGLLFVTGMARSIQFTGMMALNYADVPHEEIGGATVLGNMVSALSMTFGISLAAMLVNLLSHDPRVPDLEAFRLASLILGVIAAAAIPFYMRLREDAGASVTGHPARA